MKYPLFKVHVSDIDALDEIEKVLCSGYINEGEQVAELSYELGIKLGNEKIVLLNSCTSAITLALKLADVGPGDEVITTPMTCVATNTPIVSLGAKIVWADIDSVDGMISPNDVRRKITPKTKAVIAVAWGGTPPNLKALKKICDFHGIKLICDAAHAFGATYVDEPIAKWAHLTCFSFQAIKHFTTGDGGAITCLSESDFKRAKTLKWFGLDRDAAKDAKGDWKGQQWDVDIIEAGFKYNMNNISAAIGLSQLKFIDAIISSHRTNAALYKKLFADSFDILEDAGQTEGSSFWVYTARVLGTSPQIDKILHKLNSEGIGAGKVHVENTSYTCFKDFHAKLWGVDNFSSRQFSLPCGWWLKEDDVKLIAARVKEVVGEFAQK